MKTETPQHTPTPWHRVIGFAGDGSAGSQSEQICNAENVGVVLLQHDGSDEGNANVERIVLCVNSHDELLSACKDALESLKRLPDTDGAYRVTCISQLASAIRKAQS